MADAFYHNKLADPPGEYDTGSAYGYGPPVAQSPQEQAILDEIERAKRWRMLHGGAAMTAMGGAGASLATGLAGAPLAGILGGLGLWQGYEANQEHKKQSAAENELETYATRDRR